MTGYQLQRLRKKMDLSLRELAERWGVGKSTLQREEEKKEVRGIYADAISHLNQIGPSDE